MPEWDEEILSNNVSFLLQEDIQNRDKLINMNRNLLLKNIITVGGYVKTKHPKLKKASLLDKAFLN